MSELRLDAILFSKLLVVHRIVLSSLDKKILKILETRRLSNLYLHGFFMRSVSIRFYLTYFLTSISTWTIFLLARVDELLNIYYDTISSLFLSRLFALFYI